MNTDIRVDVGFLDHWKTDVLISECGESAVLALIRLWVFAAQNKPDGHLSCIPDEMIERIAKWRGPPGAFMTCIVKVGFLERNSNCWCLHDWAQHNPYAAHADFRRERARKAANTRYGREHATSMLVASSAHAPPPDPSPDPSPDPDPDPDPHTSVDKTTRGGPNGEKRVCVRGGNEIDREPRSEVERAHARALRRKRAREAKSAK